LWFNIYLIEIFRYGIEFRDISVLIIFLLPLVFAYICFRSLIASIDYYYRLKSSGLRSYVFSSLISRGLILKDWSLFLFLIFLYL